MYVDLVHAVGGLGDAAGELAGGDLALATEHQDRPAQPRNDRHLHAQQHDDDDSEQPALQHDEQDRRQRLATQEHRLDEGVADEAAERLDLVLAHGRELGLLDLAEVGRREAQDAFVELVTQAPQHALAHAALLGVDRLLEQGVHDHGAEEDEAHGHQVAELVDLEAIEEAQDLSGQHGRQVELPDQEGDGLGVLEGVALDAVVDDVLGHRQRHEIEDLGQHHEAQDDDLLRLAVPPDVGKQIALHQYPRSKPQVRPPPLLY